MHIALIATTQDPASMNQVEALQKQYSFPCSVGAYELSLHVLEEPLLTCEKSLDAVEADVFFFLSKHRSQADTPSFMVHSIGNWSEATAGGESEKLCGSSAQLLRKLYLSLLDVASGKDGFALSMEATHHGPFTTTPSLFLEIGSTEKEWTDSENGNIMAGMIDQALKDTSQAETVAVGIGGPHYCNVFNKLVERKGFAFSHICPKYMLEQLNEDLLKQALEHTLEDVDVVVLDWKGLGQFKQHIQSVVEKIGVEVKRSDHLLKA